MSLDRFAATEPELASLISSATGDALRHAAREAAEVAVRSARVDNPQVARAVDQLRRADFGGYTDLTAIQAIWESLDEQAWALAETESDRYLSVFAQARAVNSLWYALQPEPVAAAEGALYEALHAVADPSALRTELVQILLPRMT